MNVIADAIAFKHELVPQKKMRHREVSLNVTTILPQLLNYSLHNV